VGTLKANTLGTYNLLELAREKKAGRFLFFSSGEVYGLMDEARMPVPEDYSGPLDSTDVRSCYAESKRLGETMCVSYLHQYGVPARIVRPFHTYGPGLSLSDGRVFADFVADVVAGRDIVLRSSGDARRAFCYLADATEAFFTVLLKGTPGQAYNVGNDRAEISIRDLAELVAGLLPDRRVKVVRHEEPSSAGYLPSAVTRALPDVSKIAQLGWRPTTGLEEGFRRTIRSFL
jgi:nucleoside-diphosphate-sugar epimerase